LGYADAPLETLAVQALRNARCVEEIAHGHDSLLDDPKPIDTVQSAAPAGSLVERILAEHLRDAALSADAVSIAPAPLRDEAQMHSSRQNNVSSRPRSRLM
jgi:hypothetical protein